MMCSAPCPKCGTEVTKDIKMLAHYLSYAADCPKCGAKVKLKYEPGAAEKKRRADAAIARRATRGENS